MLNRISRVLILFVGGVYLFHFLFFWLFETTDTYYYWALAEFFRTGKYAMPHPYYWTIPSTIEPPLYSGFLYLVQFLQRADIHIHLIQIISLFAAAYFLYKVLQNLVRKEIAVLVSCIFLLIPNNLIMVSSVMAEPIALLFMSFYLYLIYEIVEKKKWHLWKYLIVFSAIIILQRFNFIVLYGFAVLIYFFKHLAFGSQKKFSSALGSDKTFFGDVRQPHMSHDRLYPSSLNEALPPKSILGHGESIRRGFKAPQKAYSSPNSAKRSTDISVFLLSLFIIFSWIFINHQLNGAWGFSNSEGKHLYDRIVGGDGLLPPANNPQLQQLRSWVGDGFDVRKPWWDIEPLILPKFGMDETRQNHFLGQIALSALREHPVEYTSNTAKNFFLIHGNGIIFPRDLYTYGWMGNLCRTIGTISFCHPLIKTEWAKDVWNTMVKYSESYYNLFPFYVNLFLLFPSLLYALLQKKIFWKLGALIYIGSVFLAVMVEVPVYRYLYPLYPLKVLLIVYFGLFLYGRIMKHEL